MNWRSFLLPAAAIVLLIFLAYSRVPQNGKVWDDEFYLTAKHLTTVAGLKQMWKEPTSTSHPYYPLTRTMFWVENRLWGENLVVHHIVNILLHVFNSLLLWRIFLALRIPGAWVIAAIFGVHPVCVESAAWIAERKNVLGVFFYLFSMLAFLKFRNVAAADQEEVHGDKKFFYLSLILFLCSLLSKTAFCTLPVALILIIWWKQGRIRSLDVRLLTPYFLLALILGALTIFVEKHHTGAQGPAFEITFLERCLIAGRAFWFYIAKTILPYEVNFMYPRWEIDTADWLAYLYPVSAFALITALWLLRKRIGRGPLVAILYFVVTLLPAIGFINHFLMRYTFVADHLQYLPMAGTLALIGSGIYQLFSAKLPKAFQYSFWAMILIVFSFWTWKQTGAYKDNFTLYNDILRKNPYCFMAFNNRGLIYLDRGERDRAISDFNRSIELNPNFEEALVSRGHFYYQQQRYEEAFHDFNRAVAVNPQFDEAYRNRGAVYFARGKYELALADFNRALYLNPKFSRAYNARGVIFSVSKRFDLALQDYSHAIRFDPAYGSAYMNRSKTFREIGRYEQALADAVKAKSLGVSGLDPYIRQLETKATQ
jgi:protein O-mannosyl-transferase